MLPYNLTVCKECTLVSINMLLYQFCYALIYGYTTLSIIPSCVSLQICATMCKMCACVEYVLKLQFYAIAVLQMHTYGRRPLLQCSDRV